MPRISSNTRLISRNRKSPRRQLVAVLLPLAMSAAGVMAACGDIPTEPFPAVSALAARDPGLGALTTQNVGAYHNQFLDFSFPIVRAAVAAGAGPARLCTVIAQAMRDFVTLKKLPVNPGTIRNDIAGGRCVSSQAQGGQVARRSLAADGTPVPELDAVVSEMTYAVESGRTLAELAALFGEKIAYAQANFPEAEAAIVTSVASVGLSSVEYWDANYTTQEAELLATKSSEFFSLADAEGIYLTASRSNASRTLIAAPTGRRQYDWRGLARRVGASDLAGAVKGGIKGWPGGLTSIATGALIEGGASSAGALIAIALQ